MIWGRVFVDGINIVRRDFEDLIIFFIMLESKKEVICVLRS